MHTYTAHVLDIALLEVKWSLTLMFSQPQQFSTYALTLYKYETKIKGKPITVSESIHVLCVLMEPHCYTVIYHCIIPMSFLQISGIQQARKDLTQCTHHTIIKHMHVY